MRNNKIVKGLTLFFFICSIAWFVNYKSSFSTKTKERDKDYTPSHNSRFLDSLSEEEKILMFGSKSAIIISKKDSLLRKKLNAK